MADPLVLNIGHMTIPVRDMKRTLGFYRDLLGAMDEGKENPVWTVVAMGGAHLTLYHQKDFLPIAIGPEGDQTPFQLHVGDFGKTAEILESKGVRLQRDGKHSGVIWDPSGNALGSTTT